MLGLHLASRYAADCLELAEGREMPFVLYVSTDLNYEVALDRLWNAFRLDIPATRKIPFARSRSYGSMSKRVPHVKLIPVDPGLGADGLDPQRRSMSDFFISRRVENHPDHTELKIGFVDLARNTAGDDWGYVLRLLALLPRPKQGGPKHLIIIDAVEGFEALVGDKDAFGEPTSRRSRIAQIMRLAAAEDGKSNLALIVEGQHRDELLPEVFITDLVVRLREVQANDYVRRTVQIEKARGYPHARGQHPFVIRSGEGSTTGTQENFDDPRILSKGVRCQAYFHVFRSLHYLSRTVMQKPAAERPRLSRPMFAGFGIQYLDDMLAGAGKPVVRIPGTPTDESGLPCCSVTGLIGDSETQKTRLGRAFLSRCFADYPNRLQALIGELLSSRRTRPQVEQILKRRSEDPGFDFAKGSTMENVWTRAMGSPELHGLLTAVKGIRESSNRRASLNPKAATAALQAAWLLSEHKEQGVAVLITTQDIDHKSLAGDFSRLLMRNRSTQRYGGNPWSRLANELQINPALLRAIAEHHFCARTICRRLEIHDLSAPIMMHIVESCIQEAQRLQLGKGRSRQREQNRRFPQSIGIRLVIDDLSVIRAIYPEMRTENLLLPYLFFYLRREGITSLIINTHPERPGTGGSDAFEQEFRALVDSRLYTWHVPFFGDDKVAIAAIPPLQRRPSLDADSDRQAVPVRELLPAKVDPVELVVNPHFELYSGLEEGKPEPVPLEIRFFAETRAFEEYISRENLVFGETFRALAGGTTVILGQPAGEYGVLRDYCSLQRHRNLNHTVVLHVDEFWGTSRRGESRQAYRSQSRYLDAESVNDEGESVSTEDSFGLFQASDLTRTVNGKVTARAARKRYKFFSPYGYDLKDLQHIDRIPFTWDFGFLLCRERCWTDAKSEPLTSGLAEGYLCVEHVWNALKKIRRDIPVHPHARYSSMSARDPNSWRTFLEATQIVAKVRGSKTTSFVPSFDLSLLTPESFSCLILEMWASEVLKNTNTFLKPLRQRNWKRADGGSLLTWLGGADYKACGIEPSCEAWLNSNGKQRPAGWWIELYKVWLLLAEVLDLPKFVEPGQSLKFTTREPEVGSVAVRHWYKTAAAQSDSFDPSDPLLPCRLPGNFSVRGDWFLAVRRGSLSDRLADQALDLLSSRRANMTRLQMGLGLPTRVPKSELKAGAFEPHKLMRVKLFKCGTQGERERATYQDLLDIGAPKREKFYWLWRSQIQDYDRHARVWHQWLGRTLLFWNRMRQDLGQKWRNGFEVYDLIDRQDIAGLKRLESLHRFATRCDFLVSELRDATSLMPAKKA